MKMSFLKRITCSSLFAVLVLCCLLFPRIAFASETVEVIDTPDVSTASYLIAEVPTPPQEPISPPAEPVNTPVVLNDAAPTEEILTSKSSTETVSETSADVIPTNTGETTEGTTAASTEPDTTMPSTDLSPADTDLSGALSDNVQPPSVPEELVVLNPTESTETPLVEISDTQPENEPTTILTEEAETETMTIHTLLVQSAVQPMATTVRNTVNVTTYDELKEAVQAAASTPTTIVIGKSISFTDTVTIGEGQDILLTVAHQNAINPTDFKYPDRDDPIDTQLKVVEEQAAEFEVLTDLEQSPLPLGEVQLIRGSQMDLFQSMFHILRDGLLTIGSDARDTITLNGNAENMEPFYDEALYGSFATVEGDLIFNGGLLTNSTGFAPIVVESDGSFEMNGGRISSNNLVDDEDILAYAGAVFTRSATMELPGGQFIFNGGLIDNNRGIYGAIATMQEEPESTLTPASIEMNGGAVVKNNAIPGFTGAISLLGEGRFTLNNGYIMYNQASIGGAVAAIGFPETSKPEVIMNGGIITRNIAVYGWIDEEFGEMPDEVLSMFGNGPLHLENAAFVPNGGMLYENSAERMDDNQAYPRILLIKKWDTTNATEIPDEDVLVDFYLGDVYIGTDSLRRPTNNVDPFIWKSFYGYPSYDPLARLFVLPLSKEKMKELGIEHSVVERPIDGFPYTTYQYFETISAPKLEEENEIFALMRSVPIDEEHDTWLITNSKPDSVFLYLQKTWDSSIPEDERPEDVTFYLMRKGAHVLDQNGLPVKITLSDGDTNWVSELSWNGFIEYIDPTAINEYSFSEETEAFLALVNVAQKNIHIEIERSMSWEDTALFDDNGRLETIVYFEVNGKKYQSNTINYNEYSDLNAGKAPVRATFTFDLPVRSLATAANWIIEYVNDADGKSLSNDLDAYTLTLTITEDGTYHLTIPTTTGNDKPFIFLPDTSSYGDLTYELINFKRPTVNIEVTKDWNVNGQNRRIPNQLQVMVTRNGQAYKTLELDANGNWTETILDLPTGDGLTNYVYTITEEQLRNFDARTIIQKALRLTLSSANEAAPALTVLLPNGTVETIRPDDNGYYALDSDTLNSILKAANHHYVVEKQVLSNGGYTLRIEQADDGSYRIIYPATMLLTETTHVNFVNTYEPPTRPDEPNEPTTPPVTPEEPETPTTPEEPTVPPVTPEVPETPTTPEEPIVPPVLPEVPETPNTPEEPSIPPVTPEVPEQPAPPTDTVKPMQPTKPTITPIKAQPAGTKMVPQTGTETPIGHLWLVLIFALSFVLLQTRRSIR